ncbi:MAG: hypothetical protein ABFR95_05750 [Actinomycetota bacterium]
MSRRESLRSVFVLISVMAMLAAGSAFATIGDAASGDIDVFDTNAEFVAVTGATAIPWVADADTALPSKPFGALLDYSCDKPSITTPGGHVTVTNPSGNWICYIGPDWGASLANTNPKPVVPTIVNNGEDDYEVVFTLANPAHAVGLDLLTNDKASETLTLTFSDGDEYIILDGDLGTDPNTHDFVGFRSLKPIVSVTLDTTDGWRQNEGIAGIWTSPYYTPPTTSCPSGQHYVSSVGSGALTPIVTHPAAAGYPYDLTTTGTFFAGGTYVWDIQADAEYSQDAWQRANLMPWTDLVNKYEGYGEGLLEMTVDGGYVEWGAFDASHSYTIPSYQATGPLEFQIYDVYAQNNTGGMCVAVEPVALRSLHGGGQLITESLDDWDKQPYKVSFGGYIDDIDGALDCEWQLNVHNVSGTDLDKTKFHGTTCTSFNTWGPDVQSLADGVANLTVLGTWNGEPGYRAIFRMEDRTEPSDLDTFRVTVYHGSDVVFESSVYQGGDFPMDSNNIGGARTLLDNGNIQMTFHPFYFN